MLGFSRTSWARFAREGLWVLAGQVAVALAGLVGLRLLTELAPPAVFGEASLWLGGLVLARNFYFVPVSMFQLRYHPDYARRGQAGTFTRRVERYLSHTTLVFSILGGLTYVGWVILAATPLRPLLLVALGSLTCLDAAKSVRQNVLAADRRQKALAAWTAAEAWAVVALSAVALWWTPTTEAYLLGTAAGYCLPFLLFALAVTGVTDAGPVNDPLTDERTFRRHLTSYGFPFVPLGVIVWATNLGDRYILDGLRGAADVGLYVAAFTLASKPATMLGGVLGTAARPVLFNAVAAGRTAAAARVFRLWLAGTVLMNGCLVAVFYALGPWIARGFLAAEYRDGAPAIIAWVAAGYGVYSAVQVLENRIMSFGRSGQLIPPAATGAALKLGLTVLFIPAHGPLGVAWATAAAFAGQFLVTAWALSRIGDGPIGPSTRDNPADGDPGR